MGCLWKWTLASVFLLLSPHSFLCQNMPSGPLPLVKKPSKECIGINLETTPQQINLISPTNGFFPEFVLQKQCPAEYQRTPECIGPAYQQQFTVQQTNIGPFPQGYPCGISQKNDILQNQSPVYNALPKTNMPTSLATPFNIVSTPLVANNPINNPPNTNLSSIQNVSPPCLAVLPPKPAAQCQNFGICPVPDVSVSQGRKPKISAIPGVPNTLNQIVLCSKRSSVASPGSALNVPSTTGFQNQNTLAFNPYSTQSSVRPSMGAPSKLSPDLTALNFLPMPNLPIPLQNYAPVPQVSFQPVAYPKSILPVDYVSNTPVCQISALPPVLPASTPQLNNNFYRNPVSVTDEYTPVPINLQINLPPPTIPEPQITIITAYPPAPPIPVNPDNSNISFDINSPYPLPPIIIEGRKSKVRSWLPLILIALIANEGCCCGGSCCDSCNSASSDMPIPYPIPIPTNNPIIIGNSSRSKKKDSKVKL